MLKRFVASCLGTLRGEWQLAARITIAALAAYWVGEILHLPQSFWAVLTAVLVTQSSLGGSVKAVTDRFVGTLSGGVWGVVVSLLVPHQSSGGMGLALLLAIAPLSVVAAAGPAYRVAPVTAVIVMLGVGGQHASALVSAVDRVLEIGLGCTVAIVISLLVLPGRAHRLLAVATRNYLDPLAKQFTLLIASLTGDSDQAAIIALHQQIRSSLAKAEAVGAEAARERRTHITEAPDPDPLLRTLRRLRHDLAVVARATGDHLPEPVAARVAGPAGTFGASVTAFLEQAGRAFAAQEAPPPTQSVRAALGDYEAAMAALRADGITRTLSEESVGRLFALAFALDQLAADLEDLAARIGEYAR